MCTGIEIGMLAAAAVGTYSAIEQGNQQKKMYNAQAQATLNNAAYDADAAKAQAEKIRKLAAAQRGEANAALAASGVKLGEGTPLEVTKDITQRSEEDALSALLNGHRVTSRAQDEASMLGQAGSNARNAGYASAASTVLSTGASIYSGWKQPAAPVETRKWTKV